MGEAFAIPAIFLLPPLHSGGGGGAPMQEVDILEQYCLRAMKMNWGSDDEMRWVIHSSASPLG